MTVGRRNSSQHFDTSCESSVSSCVVESSSSFLRDSSVPPIDSKEIGRVARTLRAEELAGDVEGLTSHNDDLLAVEQLLGNSAGQATQEVSLAVDDDLFHSRSVSDHELGLKCLEETILAGMQVQ